MEKLSPDDLLETVLLDAHKPITVTYLSRHGDINASLASKKLQAFYNSHKDSVNLHVVYLLSGSLKSKLKSNDSQLCNTSQDVESLFNPQSRMCRCTELVHEENLEMNKKKYASLDTCEIYCLHTKPIKSLLVLYNMDKLDDEKFASSDSTRSWIKCPQAETNRIAMVKDHSESVKLFENVAKIGATISDTVERSSPKRKRYSQEDQQYADACLHTKISPKKGSGTSLVRKKSGNPKAEECSNASSSCIKGKQRGCRLLSDKKDSDKRLKEESSVGKVNKHGNKKMIGSAESSTSVDGKRTERINISQDDIFSSVVSSPEDSEHDEEKTSVEKTSKSGLQRDTSLKKLERADSSSMTEENKTKVMRKEYVTESFLDDDGFMVTKRVLKEVPVQAKMQGTASTAPEKNSKPTVKEAKCPPIKKPNVRKGHTTQSKISAFFKK